MAFAEGGKKGEYFPTCHGCGRKCMGGWRECKNITEDHRSKVAALDLAGHFRRGNNNNRDTKNKKGAVNVAAEAGKRGRTTTTTRATATPPSPRAATPADSPRT